VVPPRSDRISRVPPYSRIKLLSTRTGLSPTMARLSRRFRFLQLDHWPGPRSLATTSGVSVDVLSSSYLDVSVRWVCFLNLFIQFRIPLNAVGFPIRKSSDQSLLATPRSLSQRATSFIASQCQGIHQMPLLRLIRENVMRRDKPGADNRGKIYVHAHAMDNLCCRTDSDQDLFTMTKSRWRLHLLDEVPKTVNFRREAVVLTHSVSTLSRRMVEVNGIEPMTSCLQSRRSPN
jgi:hypothetical protein